MSRYRSGLLGLSFLLAFRGALWSSDIAPDPILKEKQRIKAESETRIQKDILDWVFGPNVAKAFVDVKTGREAEAARKSLARRALKLQVTIMHDDRVLDPVKDEREFLMIKRLVVKAMAQYQLSPEQILFIPVHFNRRKLELRDEFQIPKLYL